ncbi:MAG: hypothetical protein JXR73_22105 [Candidatus Omnitrophica bacterium]|nr:hypothetical protein [Candidatus Omnitrophota bacterium]
MVSLTGPFIDEGPGDFQFAAKLQRCAENEDSMLTSHRDQVDSSQSIHWIAPVLCAAMAGGMAWGIRGQYGHETGAMIAGLLVSLTLIFLLCPRAPQLTLARAAALGAVAMGFGGSMTYGQTVGLTHDAALTGNWEALRWGMIGLSIKGGVWIGFAGVFLGMGLGGVRYRFRETLLLMIGLIGAYFAGVYLLNSPYDPAGKSLPAIYFSADWHWTPVADLKPRRECWGGLWFALIAAIVYSGFLRKDRLARNLALWGILGGAVGFPLGQSLQAYHAWNPDVFRQGLWATLDPHMNWWNMMETTYGAVMGASLGFGLWLNREHIRPCSQTEEVDLPCAAEWILLAIHIGLLAAVEFLSIPFVDAVYDLGLMMGIIPMAAIVGGRWWPYLVVFPVTLIPIAGKTVRQLVYNEAAIAPAAGWLIYLIIPLFIAAAAAVWFGRRPSPGARIGTFPRCALLLNAWMYFLLNYAFFRFPWPWADWTGRTPNGIIFTICVLGLTAAVLWRWNLEPPPGGEDETIKV